MHVNTGFQIRFENRLPCRATNIKLRLPDKTFWLPDNINVKYYSKLLVARHEEMAARATGYVKP